MPHTDTDEVTHVPSHYRIFACALTLTTATLAIQAMHAVGGPAVEQAVITLRVACTIVWAWFFTAYAVHALCRHMDALQADLAERLTALEGRVEEMAAEHPRPRPRGLDTDAIESARVIAMNLMRQK